MIKWSFSSRGYWWAKAADSSTQSKHDVEAQERNLELLDGLRARGGGHGRGRWREEALSIETAEVSERPPERGTAAAGVSGVL